jgi:hypothetical protein
MCRPWQSSRVVVGEVHSPEFPQLVGNPKNGAITTPKVCLFSFPASNGSESILTIMPKEGAVYKTILLSLAALELS